LPVFRSGNISSLIKYLGIKALKSASKPKGVNVSRGSWDFKPTVVVRLVEAVKKATGLPVRNVEFSLETKLIRVNVGAPGELTSVFREVNSEELRKLL
jgi:hypothetical protein